MFGISATLLLGAISYASPRHVYDLPSTLMLAEVLRPLACSILVAFVVRDQRILGHDPALSSRGYPWKNLIGSKLLLLLTLVNLPIFACHIAILASFGISPLHWIPALLWRQLFVTVYFILPAAALASVTRNDLQMLCAAIGICAVWIACSESSHPLGRTGSIARLSGFARASVCR
jgi:hypothetical protein